MRLERGRKGSNLGTTVCPMTVWLSPGLGEKYLSDKETKARMKGAATGNKQSGAGNSQLTFQAEKDIRYHM